MGHMLARVRGVPEWGAHGSLVVLFLHRRQARRETGKEVGRGGGDLRRLESVHMRRWRRAGLNRAGPSRTKEIPKMRQSAKESENMGRARGKTVHAPQ